MHNPTRTFWVLVGRVTRIACLVGSILPLRAENVPWISSSPSSPSAAPPAAKSNSPVPLIASGIGLLTLLATAGLIVPTRLRRRRAARHAFTRSISTLHTAFDSIADGVLVVDRAGRVARYNQRFLDLCRIPRELAELGNDEALVQRQMAECKDSSAFRSRVAEVYADPELSCSDTLEFRDGRVLERDSRPHREAGEVVGRIWTFRDITPRIRAEEDRRRMAEELAQAQKMEALGTLAGGIAHDFNNILTGVIGYAELARARLPATHPSAEDLTHVLRAGERAKDLIRQILTFSRKSTIEKGVVAFQPIVRDTLKLLRAVAPASIEIHAELPDQVLPVCGDPTQLHQALLNLATNAMHAMGRKNGLLKVTLSACQLDASFTRLHPPLEPGRHVCLAVSDTGHGMDAATLSRIFEPFFTTKAVGDGTGLGLSVVHGILQAHAGALTVESTLEIGTTFRLYFPLLSETALSPESVVEQTPRGAGELILVVDDEAMVADVSTGFLLGLGYRVIVCHTAEQALAEFQANREAFAGVISDLNMPHVSGLELLRRLRSERPDLAVVLCTGYIGSAGTEAEAALLGVREIVSKPFTCHGLGVALHRALYANSAPSCGVSA